jgi:hypothetical protein
MVPESVPQRAPRKKQEGLKQRDVFRSSNIIVLTAAPGFENPVPDAASPRDTGREAAIDELMLPRGAVHGLGPDQHGPEEFKFFFKIYRDAFPDIQVTIESTVSEDDLAAVRWTAAGTHKGDGLGFPATGKRVEHGNGFSQGREWKAH